MTPDLKSLKELHRAIAGASLGLSDLAEFYDQDDLGADREEAAAFCGHWLVTLYSDWIDYLTYVTSDVDWFAGDRVVNLCGLRATSYHKAIGLLAEGVFVSALDCRWHSGSQVLLIIAQWKQDAGGKSGPEYDAHIPTGAQLVGPISDAEKQEFRELEARIPELIKDPKRWKRELPPIPTLLLMTPRADNLEELKTHIKQFPVDSEAGCYDVVLTREGLQEAEPWLSIEYNRALRQFIAKPQPLEPRGTKRRFRTPPCPRCGRRAQTTSTRKDVRHCKCTVCGHTWAITRRPV